MLALDPQAHHAGRRLVRVIAGNSVTMGADDPPPARGRLCAPVTILIQELPGGETQVAYDLRRFTEPAPLWLRCASQSRKKR